MGYTTFSDTPTSCTCNFSAPQCPLGLDKWWQSDVDSHNGSLSSTLYIERLILDTLQKIVNSFNVYHNIHIYILYTCKHYIIIYTMAISSIDVVCSLFPHIFKKKKKGNNHEPEGPAAAAPGWSPRKRPWGSTRAATRRRISRSSAAGSSCVFIIWQCVKTLYPCSSHQNSW